MTVTRALMKGIMAGALCTVASGCFGGGDGLVPPLPIGAEVAAPAVLSPAVPPSQQATSAASARSSPAASQTAAQNTRQQEVALNGAQHDVALNGSQHDVALEPATIHVSFTPVTGAPADAITPLSRSLDAAARENRIAISPVGDPVNDNILKGYFSAAYAAGQVNVSFVWDVLGADGKRLHRIQGQERVAVATAPSDPWSAVSPGVMETIAARTISDYVAWRNARAQ